MALTSDSTPLALTMGDPGGIGPEIVVKALVRRKAGRPISVYGSLDTLRRVAHSHGLPPPEEVAQVVDIPSDDAPLGRPSVEGGRAAVAAIDAAARDALSGRVAAIVTAPISKTALRLAGYPWPGHTELLAELSGAERVAMMFAGGSLRVALATVHESLRDACRKLDGERVRTAIELLDAALARGGGARRIGCCGLNPHAGEGGLFGDEEARLIAPEVARLRERGIDVSGPHPADTLFVRAGRGEFDGVVAMYHDQGLIPVKLAAFGSAVNVTLGLPFVRTSVDHGTAFDIAGQGKADASSLLAAIEYAEELLD